jgi:hypothetical protein
MVPCEREQGRAAEGDSGTSQDLDELPAVHPALHRVAAHGALGIVTPDGCRILHGNGFPAHASGIGTSRALGGGKGISQYISTPHQVCANRRASERHARNSTVERESLLGGRPRDNWLPNSGSGPQYMSRRFLMVLACCVGMPLAGTFVLSHVTRLPPFELIGCFLGLLILLILLSGIIFNLRASRLHRQVSDRLDGANAGARVEDSRDESAKKLRRSSAAPVDRIDLVHFHVTSPPRVARGDAFLIKLWAHLERHQSELLKRIRAEAQQGETQLESQGPFRVGRGIELVAHLEIEDIIVHAPIGYIIWTGVIGKLSFPARVPLEARDGDRQCVIQISIEGATICLLHFVISIGLTKTSEGQIHMRERRVKNAFASYANQDRLEVLKRVQGIEAAGIKVWLDVVGLRPGDDWTREIQEWIRKADIFYLFWSRHAARSEWVEREAQIALETKGQAFIRPVLLELPAQRPVWLRSKHLNDYLLYIIEHEQHILEAQAHCRSAILAAENPPYKRVPLKAKARRLLRKWRELVRQAGPGWNADWLLRTCAVLALLGFLGGRYCGLAGNIWLSLLLSIVMGAIPIAVVTLKRRKRSQKLDQQFPELVKYLASAMESGRSFTISLEKAGGEFPEPLGSEVRALFEEQNLGAPLSIALANFAARVPLSDVRVFASFAGLCSAEKSAAEVLQELSSLMRER